METTSIRPIHEAEEFIATWGRDDDCGRVVVEDNVVFFRADGTIEAWRHVFVVGFGGAWKRVAG
jgi:hypothetical protein